MPSLGRESIDIAPDERIRGEDQIVVLHFQQAFCALGPRQRKHAKAWRDESGFGQPVENQGRRHDDQRRMREPSGLLFHEHMGERLGGFSQPHFIGQDPAKMVGPQILQPGQTVELVIAQGDAQTVWCLQCAGGALFFESVGEQLKPRIALQLPLIVGRDAACLNQGGTQRLDAAHVPMRQCDGLAVTQLLACGIGDQIDHGAQDGLDRSGRHVDAFAADGAQLDGGQVVHAVDMFDRQPARIACEQVGQHGNEIERHAVDLDAEAQQPCAFATSELQRLHGLGFGGKVARHLQAFDFARIVSEADMPALHCHAFVCEAGAHVNVPTFAAQLGQHIGPEVGEHGFLRQRPERAKVTGDVGMTPLQAVGLHGREVERPDAVHRILLGMPIALDGAGLLGGARCQYRAGRRCLPERAIRQAVDPVDLREADRIATWPELALRAHAQQTIASAQRHECDAGSEAADVVVQGRGIGGGHKKLKQEAT